MTSIEQALIRLAQCHREVKMLTDQIQTQIHMCVENAAAVNNGMLPSDFETHLSLAYKETTETDSYYEGERRLNIHEVAEVLESEDEREPLRCPYCAAAHRTIQERKKARIALGNAKGAITRMALHRFRQTMNNS